MSQEQSPAVHELEAMTQHLEDYLLGDRLYKTITAHESGGDHLIKMTLGGMLERIAESEGPAPDSARAARDALALAQRTMPDRFFAMLGREAKSYTDSWNWFLQNCWEGDARCRSDYGQEVGIRLRLERLLDYGGSHAELSDSRLRLQKLDERLRAIWEPSSTPRQGNASDYPQERYWWLYGQPHPQEA